MKDVYLTNARTAKLLKSFCQQSVFLKTMLVKYVALFLTGLICQQLFAQPVITSFSPLSGLPGSTVSIYGSGFSSTPSENIIFVGGAHAYVLTASSNKLTVQVPRGITNKLMSVTTNNLTGFSAVPFITTYKTGNAITTGTFETPKNFHLDTRPNLDDGLTIEDLDGDGKPDIFAIGRFSVFNDFYTTLRNTSNPGNISFSTPATADLPFSYERHNLLLADLNGDGKKDFISANESEFDILINTSSKGAISFNNLVSVNMDTTYSTGLFITTAGFADLNADGKMDLYMFDEFNYKDSMLFAQNTGSGDQISFAQPVVLPFNAAFSQVLIDFNGDQKVDMLSTGQDAIVIRNNISKNGIVSFDNPKNICLNTLGTFLGVTDINKDGKPDVVITNTSNQKDSLYFLLNTSTAGNLSFASPLGFYYGFNTADTRFVDIDGDGKLDITGYDAISRSYVIVKNTSSAKRLSFAAPVLFFSIKSHANEYGDFDGDGKQDLAFTVKDYLSFVSVLRNQTDTATGIPSITSFYPPAGMPADTIIIDGENFNSTTNVSLGGTLVESFKVISNNRISAIVGHGNSGGVQVSTTMGMASRSRFTYITDTTIKLLSTVSDILCSGKIVRVKAVVSNAYSGIKYTWYRNGKIDPISSNIYSSHSLNDGDSVWCVVSFAGLPADKALKSEVIKFNVNLSQTPRFYIQSSKGTLICKGTPVTFKAIVKNGDFKPVYQWQKNNVVVGDTTDTYLDNSLQNSDIIRCTIVRAQQCTVLPATASLQMNVDDSRPSAPVAIVGPDEVSPSQANIIFSVPHPTETRTFKWQIPSGAAFVSGNGTDSVTVNWSNTTAKISVGAGNACGVSAVITKTVRVTSANSRVANADTSKQITNETSSLVVYPNPAISKTTVMLTDNASKYNVMELRDGNGKLLLHKKLQMAKGVVSTDINTAAYAPGVYYIVLIDQNNNTTSKQLIIAK